MAKTKDNNDRETPRELSPLMRGLATAGTFLTVVGTIPHLTRDTSEELQGGWSWQKKAVDCVPKGKTPTPDQIADALSKGETSLPVCPPTYQATESIGVSNGTCLPDNGLLSGFQGKCKEGEVEGVDWKEVDRPTYTVCKITRDGKSGPCPDEPNYKPTDFYQLK